MNDFQFPAGVDGIEALRDQFAQVQDPAQRHAVALRHIHWYPPEDADGDLPFDLDGEVDLVMSRFVMGYCRELINQRVPCSRANLVHYAAAAFIQSPWPQPLAHETGELFREYIRAGYVRLNDSEDAWGAQDQTGLWKAGRTPLEVAIRKGRTEAVVVLIEEGARTDMAPANDRKGQSYSDMFQLADAWWADGSMVASMRGALMRRRVIQMSEVSERQAALLPPPVAVHRRPRASL